MSVFQLKNNNETQNSRGGEWKQQFNPRSSSNNFDSVEDTTTSQFQRLKKGFNNSRRDPTIVIKDFAPNKTSQYANRKETLEPFQDKVKNDIALAGSNSFLNEGIKKAKDLYSNNISGHRNNEYSGDMYVRPENIDGEITPSGVLRPKERSQEQLRGYGVNSIRLQSEGKINATGLQNRSGAPAKYEDKLFTKNSKKKYYEQNPEDYIKTTGLLMKPFYRDSSYYVGTNRSVDQTYNAPAKILNSVGEFRNNQPTNPTQYEEYMVNIPVTNPRGINNNMTSRNNQPARPTQYEEYMENTPITNPRGINNNMTRRNNQPANPTQFEDYSENIGVTNVRGRDNMTYRNNQPANPTQFEDYSENNLNGHAHNKNSNIYYNNNQPANPTQRDDNNIYIGPIERSSTLTYLKSIDKTRSGVVEEVLAKDYNGIKRSVADSTTDRKFMKNYENNTSIEKSIDRKNRKFAGGYGQMSANKDTFGNIMINSERSKSGRNIRGSTLNRGPDPNLNIISKKSNVQPRDNINNLIVMNMNGNPYINNSRHKSNKNTVDSLLPTINILTTDDETNNNSKLKNMDEYKYDPKKF